MKISLFDAFKQLLTLHKLTPTSDATSQLKVVTGTLNAQKYQDEILESGVRSPFDSLDGQNMCSEMTLQYLTVLASSRNIKINRTSLKKSTSTAELFTGLEPYRTRVGQARLTCLKPGTSPIKTIVNFARLYCMSGAGLHVLNACTQ